MKRKISLFLFSLVLALSFGSLENVWACSCLQQRPVCEAFGNAKAVFIGEVVEGKSMKLMSEILSARRDDLSFVFKVRQNFLDTEEKNITVHTGFGFGDCGFPFQKGEIYLVYAYEYEGKLQTSVCTRTRPVSIAESDFEDLKYLLFNRGAKIYGTVTRKIRSSLEQNSEQPMNNLKIQIQQLDGAKKKFEVITDQKGKYELKGLSTGKYQVLPSLPDGLEVSDYATDAFLLNDKGCANKDFYVKNDSLITGKVIDFEGKPVKSMWVEIIPVTVTTKPESVENEFGLTDSNGTFRLYNIPEGKYIIGFNYVNQPDEEHPFPTYFYKNASERTAATIIDIGLGQNIKNLIIQLPKRLAQKEVRGKIVWADGNPAAEIYVGLKDIKKNYSISNTETDELGNFVLKGFIGEKYFIDAGKYEEINEKEFQSSGESPIFTLDLNTQTFRIILKRKQIK